MYSIPQRYSEVKSKKLKNKNLRKERFPPPIEIEGFHRYSSYMKMVFIILLGNMIMTGYLVIVDYLIFLRCLLLIN